MAEKGDLRNLIKKNMMGGNSRKRRSTWDNKEENQTLARSTEHGAWQERESYPRHHGRDPESYDIESDNAVNSRDSPKWPSREQSPRKSDRRDAKRDSYDIQRNRRSADVAKSYPVSPRNHGPGRKNNTRSPGGTWDRPRRSRSRGRVRVRGGSRSPSRGRNRSRSISRGRERDKGYGRSRSPLNDYRRDPHGGRRSGFVAPPPQVRKFTAGNGRRGSQDRFIHLDNPKPRNGGRPDRDQTERWGMRGERGGSHYDVEREEPARKSSQNVCNDFLNGRCHRGSLCRFSHDTAGDNSQERHHHIAPCKFFMMGNCSRSSCKFAHDGPMQDNREMVPCDDRRDRDYSSIQDNRDRTSRVDRRDRDYGSKSKTWNGPTWDETDKSKSGTVVKDGGWNGPIYDDVAASSDIGRTGGWGNSGIENAEATNGSKNKTWNGRTWEEAEKSKSGTVVKDGWNGPIYDDVAAGSDVGRTGGSGNSGIESTEATNGSKNKTWNGSAWEEAEKSKSCMVAKDGGWNGPIYDNVAGGSDVRTGGWGNRGIENTEATNRLIAERVNYDELNHLEDESKIWAASGSHDANKNIPGSKALEINSVEPQSTFDSMKYQTPYDFSGPTSTVTHSVVPENPQLYSMSEENKLVVRGFDRDNNGNVYTNANQPTPVPGGKFDQQSGTHGLPSQQFGGISQGQLDLPIWHNTDFNGPAHENITPFDAQSSVVAQHEHSVKPIVSMPQMIEHQPVQIPRLPSSLTEKFVNEQLPQLYEALNPRRPAEPISSMPDYMNSFLPAPSINIEPSHTSIYQKRNGDVIESKKLENINQHPGRSSDFVLQNGGSMNNNHLGLLPSQQKMIPKPVLEETSKPTAEKPNQEPENNGAGNVEAETNIGDGADWKEEKAMRLFKNSLVEFVKDILKPKWKEGGMTKDVYKAIVKKVVDKVTSATQGVNIPSTQAKLDHYLQYSKPKLAKLVEAYVERYAKTS